MPHYNIIKELLVDQDNVFTPFDCVHFNCKGIIKSSCIIDYTSTYKNNQKIPLKILCKCPECNSTVVIYLSNNKGKLWEDIVRE